MKKNYVVGAVRALTLFSWVLFMPLFYMLAQLLRVPGHKGLIPFFHAGTCRILGIQITKSGEMTVERPALYVSNHVSYIDIFILGCLPAYFIAKSEVAAWPVFGKLAKFQNTLFFERKAGRAKDQLLVLQQHLMQGDSLTFFPEGTSTNGALVKPFKSTLFEAANLPDQSVRVAIQPITVAYTHYAGQHINSREVLDHYAWYARMPFLSHFLGLMPLKKVGAKIHFHPVCYMDEFATRKECADHCQKLVADKLSEFVHDELRGIE